MPHKIAQVSALWLVLTFVACSPADDAGPGSKGGGPSAGSGGALGSGGTKNNSGGSANPGTGGLATGGAVTGVGGTTGGTGTTLTGGSSGNAPTGGSSAGGTVASGGSSATTGGASTGGDAQTTGGRATSGSGGAATGGKAAGGSATGGAVSATGGTGGATTIGASGLPAPPGAANVPKPSGTAGGLTVLNWAGFKGAVTYTFDDANSSQISHYSELQALGVRYTFYLITGKTEASNAIWAQAVKDGHELANHTKSHSSNGTGQDIDDATAFIKQKFGVDVWTMAAPNGAAVYTDLAKPRFLINRGVNNGLVAANDSTDPFTLFCYIPPEGAAASAFNSEIDSARSAGKWRIVLVHGFTGGSDGAYQPVAIGEFTSSVTHAKSLTDMWLDSMVNVGAYWRGQKAFSSVTATTFDSDKVWTWTLPAHFPPGKYLRVKVDGGTLKQDGAALAWDSHGYYEVALDAGSLTLSP